MGLLLTDSNKNLKKIAGKSMQLPLGAIFCSAVTLTNPAFQRLDGRSLAINGTYSKFCQWLISQSNAGLVPTCTITEYGSEITAHGQCGKFVINNTNSAISGAGVSLNANSIKLPTIASFIESSNVSNLIGETKKAGLPNIIGGLGANNGDPVPAFGVSTSSMPSSGAFSTNYRGRAGIGGSGSGYLLRGNIYFDASKSNNIYGSSTTVQPKSISYPYYIVVATSTQTSVEIDINNYVNELNSKASKDLSNVSYPTIVPGMTTIGSGDRVVENYMSSDGLTWYRKWASGWKECGGTTTTSSTSNAVTINLPIVFSNSNFIVVMNKGYLGTSNAVIGDISVVETYSDGSTTSYFQTRGYNSPLRYYACGY